MAPGLVCNRPGLMLALTHFRQDEGMRLGFGLPVAGAWSSADSLRLVAQRAEELGYDSVWGFQRLLHPADGDWGPSYRSVQDPLIVLAHVAALTRRVRLGVAVLNAPFVPPVVLAKQLTTLDLLSDGRLDVGLGLGWADAEFDAVGIPRSERVQRTVEAVTCLRSLWGPDPVSCQGRHAHVAPALVQPKPVQQPHPPILMGGSARAALRRVGRLGDGWITSSRQDLRRVGEDIDVVRKACESSGRDPALLRVVVRGVVRLGKLVRDSAGRRHMLTGTLDDVRADLDALERVGVTEVFVDPNFIPEVVFDGADPNDSLDRALSLLEDLAPGRR